MNNETQNSVNNPEDRIEFSDPYTYAIAYLEYIGSNKDFEEFCNQFYKEHGFTIKEKKPEILDYFSGLAKLIGGYNSDDLNLSLIQIIEKYKDSLKTNTELKELLLLNNVSEGVNYTLYNILNSLGSTNLPNNLSGSRLFNNEYNAVGTQVGQTNSGESPVEGRI